MRLLQARVSLLALLCVLVAAMPATAQTTTALVFDSQPGDYIGQGIDRTYTLSDGAFEITGSPQNGVNISVIGPNYDFWWYLRFYAPTGSALAVGSYLSAERFATPFHPALDVSGDGRGCNRQTGRFEIRQVVWGSNNTVLAFAADFEQHCEDGSAGLYGVIRYNSTISDLVPFDPIYRLDIAPDAHGRVTGTGLDCGEANATCQVTFGAATQFQLTAVPSSGYIFAGWSGGCRGGLETTVHVNSLKSCAATFVPLVLATPRTIFYWDTPTGNYIGPSRQGARTPATTTWNVTSSWNENAISVRIDDGDHDWTVDFAAPSGEALAVGTYNNARRFSPLNSLSVSGSGTGCYEATGRFAILELVRRADSSIERFAVDFEYHCPDAAPALFGAIRYNSTIGEIVPFGGAYPSYVLTIVPSSDGRVTGTDIDCGSGGSACQTTLSAPATRTLTATPNAGSVFLGWAGSCIGTATTSVLVNGPKECTAIFEPLISPAPRSVLYWESQPGDYIGGGTSAFYLPSNSLWAISSSSGGRVVEASIRDATTTWSLSFAAPQGQTLTVGSYGNARRYPFARLNGLSVSGSGRGCNQLTGRFVILEIVLGTNGTVQRFAADFEQHCEDAVPGLFGSIRYNSTVDEVVPFGGNYPLYQLSLTAAAHGRMTGSGLDCGGAGTQCQVTLANAGTVSLTAIPDFGYVFLGWSGDCRGGLTTSVHVNGPKQCAAIFEPQISSTPRTVLYVDSEPGDTAGGGAKAYFSPANSIWSVTSAQNGNRINLIVSDSTSDWRIDFSAPTGQALAAGYYGAVRSYPWTSFNGLLAGGGYCSDLTGRFVILELVYGTNGTVIRFAADIEQHCADRVPALFAAIRYNSTISEIVPFAGAYPTYQLSVVRPAHGLVSATGLSCGTSATQCTLGLASAASVALTATPDFGYIFMGWTEDCSGGTSTTLHVNGPKRCAALFEPAVATAPRTLLRWDSQPNHYIGQGRSEALSPGNSRWGQPFLYQNGNRVELVVESVGPLSDSEWHLVFQAPTGQVLESGRQYLNAGSTATATTAALSIFGNGRSCSSGQFTVREIAISPQGALLRFAADFVLTCSSPTGPQLTGSVQYNSLIDVPVTSLSVEPASLRFASIHNGASIISQPAPQTVRLNVARQNVGWTAVPNQSWIQVSPSSGVGSTVLTIGANLLNGHPGTGSASGLVTVTLTDGTGTSRTISLTVTLYQSGTTRPPIGVVDTPLDNASGVNGAIPMTGWALDDLDVASLTICRAAVSSEAPGPDGNCGGNAQIFVGNGVFIEGARPDVQAAFPQHPRADRGGWGFMMLTNMLPNRGNGTFVFYIYARDREGQVTLIGTRTMTVNNAAAIAPFGTIDTPAQGETISGANYPSFGWVLTPMPKSIPFDGSTITVWIDGVPIGSPSYNHFRADVAGLFPGLANSNGPLGLRTFDTTPLTNGLHTIVWTATDSAGVTSGLGSRYFRVANGASSSVTTSAIASVEASTTTESASSLDAIPVDSSSIVARRTWNADAPWQNYGTGRSGRAVIRGEEIDRFEIALGEHSGQSYSGYLRVGERLRPLPIGSTLDVRTGTFTWSPGVGFVGTYDLVFVRSIGDRAIARQEVRIVLHPKGSGHIGTQVVIDTPRMQQDVAQPFMLAGWAADLDAASGTGIDTLHVWAYPLTGGAPIFLGTASHGGVRPDVAAVHGDQFRDAGWGLSVQGLPPGNYDLAVFGWSTVTGGFAPAQVVRLTVR